MKDLQVDIAIIGAGPYGLSVAAHLQARGSNYRVFGKPMHTWLTSMPKGMLLKSDGFASTLSEPKAEFTLKTYCAEQGIPYADMGDPMVKIETFIEYGLAFRRRFVSHFDERLVTNVGRASSGFVITLDDGTLIMAQRVVVAVGITYFANMPDEFSALPPDLCSHTSQVSNPEQFAARHVVVVGAGSSALDYAALLNRAGAKVEVIARASNVRFHEPMQIPRPLVERILWPTSGLGPGWRSRFYTDAAPIFRHLPGKYRAEVVRNSFGPVGAWFTRDDVIGKVPIEVETVVVKAEPQGDEIRLMLRRSDGAERELICDHLIVATGFRMDLGRIEILDQDLRSAITLFERMPILSAHFESSVRGLYFIGPIAANSFGPMMRFAFGTRFAARRLVRHLAKAKLGR